ncbi:peptidylprolyl isomerase [Rasiella rasia]|uniref:peptidylprolyl isomerase n=1 Tax=Rasiella rasia TaxID=2744027 RepID=A0A6G6GJP9_9FLAO|nr:peptidylprolyl isomerase [Rasiella rasia]QIE58768.1 peptidylprolyl isomerase [Rasiella rasia]
MSYFIKISAVILIALTIHSCKQPSETLIPQENPRKKIEMTTNYGTMIIELFNETPLHRDNFTNLARNKAYDSILFHRVINQFMIQAGDPESKKATPTDTLGEGDAPYMVKAEFNDSLFHKKGVLAAARDNNPEKSSSAMQFYIVQGKVFNDSLIDLAEIRLTKNKAIDYFKEKSEQTALLDSVSKAMFTGKRERYMTLTDSVLELAIAAGDFHPYSIPEYQKQVYKTIGGTPHLDQNYTVFGEVVKGLDILDSIASVETSNLDRPLKDVRIFSVKVIEE